MTTLLIIACIWLWVMIGLWVCQMVLRKYKMLKFWDVVLGISVGPVLVPFAVICGLAMRLYDFNPVIWRKKR